MTENPFRQALSALASATARPEAFLIVVAYGALWVILEPHSFDMHALATLVVWTMTLIIQRAEHGDTQAIHAKLDELLQATGQARDEIAEIDDEEPEDIEKEREGQRENG
jgi:low affinity Fe/Cu permease